MIIALVGLSVSQKIDLVSDDYYAMELVHQQKIDKIARAAALPEGVTWKVENEYLEVVFPASFKQKVVTGKIMLYCPSDNRKDLSLPLKLDGEMTQRIPRSTIRSGRYHLQVDWVANDAAYWNEGIVNL
ncbi:hypothetical protein GCM10023091_26020 [Ravibacter arvi]|uniref:FixH protein n=2 Tax=Ravibacter arvi TaxID=2051041 RepID=A0ABP8M0P5_9BACT